MIYQRKEMIEDKYDMIEEEELTYRSMRIKSKEEMILCIERPAL